MDSEWDCPTDSEDTVDTILPTDGVAVMDITIPIITVGDMVDTEVPTGADTTMDTTTGIIMADTGTVIIPNNIPNTVTEGWTAGNMPVTQGPQRPLSGVPKE